MRDNHEGYPELKNTYERDDLYFGVVRIEISGEAASLEFAVEQKSYVALKRILQTRPFDRSAPAAEYRYFFTGGYTRRKLDEEPVTISVRIEQGGNAKDFDFDCPTSLASNLRWFISLSDLSQAAQLKRVD